MKTKGWMSTDRVDPSTKDVIERHILPVARVPVFKTREEAACFMNSVIGSNNPMVTVYDDDGQKASYTYFGHIQSPDCHCRPKREQEEVAVYVHAHVC